MLVDMLQRNTNIPDYVYLNDRLVYIDYIDRNYTYSMLTVNPMDAYRHQGNLYALFEMIGIDTGLYVYAMYLNGYTNPLSYDGKQLDFKKPVDVPIPAY